MDIGYSLPPFQTVLGTPKDAPAIVAVTPKAWWPLTQIVMAGLLVTYLVGIVQDFQRVRDLRAEPSPPSKIIITKNEAWQRIHSHLVPPSAWDMSARNSSRDAP